MAKTAAYTNDVTLDDLISAADSDFKSLFVEITGKTHDDGSPYKVELRPLLSLPREDRDELSTLVDDLPEGKNVDYMDIYLRWAEVVARTPEQFEVLRDYVGDRANVFQTIQKLWKERTEPGEASPSRK